MKSSNTTNSTEQLVMNPFKLDMIFFMSCENSTRILTYEEIQSIASKYSARSLWYLWQHTKRYNKYIKSKKNPSC